MFPFLFLGLLFEYYRLSNSNFGDLVHKYLHRLFKEDERSRINSSITFVTGCYIAILYFDKSIAIPAMFILNLADPIACIIGTKWGRVRIGQKTLEGSLAFFLISFVILFLSFNFKTALSASLLCAITELIIRTPIDDNLVLPPISGLYIYLMLLFN